VVSFSVAQRTNEFGVRMALGAQPNNVVWLAVASTGVAVGSGLSQAGCWSLGWAK
jgi:ABC-type antimicrobial peptide transport system permease subunit